MDAAVDFVCYKSTWLLQMAIALVVTLEEKQWFGAGLW